MVHHLITAHRHLTLKNVHHHAMQYIRQPICTAQDAVMMFAFICDSLTSDTHAQVTLEAHKYMINGMTNGPCFLKVVLIQFHVETNAIGFHLGTCSILLPKTIIMLNLDITTFNLTVQEITKELAA